jgi:aspartate aminotransferase/aminotransferase
MKNYLADRTKLIDASGIRKVFALGATLKDPVNFSIGQPEFDVPEPVKEAAIAAIRGGQNRYSQTAGENAVLELLRPGVKAETGWDKPEVMLTNGVSGGLLLAFMALINPGDEVIVPDPYFVMYKHLVRMLGGTCVFVDSYPDFKLPVEKIAAAVTDKTKLILLNTPCNPTGAVYSVEEVRAVAEIAKKRDIILLSDEIYDMFCYEGHSPCIGKYYDKTILLKGFSKSFGMTGWRLGYAACSESLKPLMESMLMIQQYTFVCAPTPFQLALPTALGCDMHSYVEAYRVKRDMLYDGLKDTFGVHRPGGAFYMFAQKPDRYATATEFVKDAIAHNVLIIPGNVFSERDTHFRMCYTTTEDKIRQGAEILCRLAKGS